MLLGDDRTTLKRQLAELFPQAELTDTDSSFIELVTETLHHAEPPALGRTSLPADVLGIALRQRVRQALRDVPAVSAARRAG